MEDKVEVPIGFRFYPTEEELISFYLHHQLRNSRPDILRVIPLLHLYDYHPSHLPQLAGEYCPADGEQWFFFLPRQEREARGGRPNRLTSEGYWKATGSPVHVFSSQDGRVIGRKKTMVFYVGRAPNGRKTTWKMNEYKAIQSSSSSNSSDGLPTREDLSLCRIYKRTKCLRSFDRRPALEHVTDDHCDYNQQAAEVTVADEQQQQQQQQQIDHGAVLTVPEIGEDELLWDWDRDWDWEQINCLMNHQW